MLFISLKECFIAVLGILSLILEIFVEGVYMVALPLAVLAIKQSTFHPSFIRLSISDWYF